jgi:hypothetical protein
VLASLHDALGDAAPADGASGDGAAHAPRLAALLGAGDGDALEYLQAHAGALRALFAAGEFDAFARDVQSFDFDAALTRLRHAAAARGLALENLA